MKKFKFKIRGNDFETVVNSFENNVVDIEVNGTKYSVEVEKEKKNSKTPKLVRARIDNSPADASIKKTTQSEDVKAPLPGTIIEVKVKVGDQLKMGDVILIMEAMKMENNILAEKDGTVKAINVVAGANVLQNDTLIEMG